MPIDQVGDHVTAINAVIGPHFIVDNFALQIRQSQMVGYVNPNTVGQFRVTLRSFNSTD